VDCGYDFGQKAMTVGSADDMLKENKQYQHHDREKEIYTYFLCVIEEISCIIGLLIRKIYCTENLWKKIFSDIVNLHE